MDKIIGNKGEGQIILTRTKKFLSIYRYSWEAKFFPKRKGISCIIIKGHYKRDTERLAIKLRNLFRDGYTRKI